MDGGRLGAYVLDRELGSGGMGRVYAATVAERAPGLAVGDRVALKVVHPHLLETQGFFMRFLREAQLGASIEHQNVVRTHLCDQVFEDGRPHAFLVMELVSGQNLRDLLAELGQVPEELCRHIGREIAKGLGAIHAQGVVHRDLKPENVLITADHVVKVMDLGVARLADEQLRLSHSGAFVGSAEYAAPEQFGGSVDHRCDLHALGLLLYELSCGRHPYRADDFRSVMKRVCEVEPRRLGDVNPQLSAFFEELVHKLLAKSADERFADSETVLSVLEQGEDSEWWRERARQLQATSRRPLRRIRIPRETAVYGRDDEIERLRAMYQRAKAGEGQVVLIEGEAGIGRSRLVDEVVSRLQRDGEDVNFLFGSYPPGGAASAAGAFSTAFREHLGAAGAAAYLPRTPLLVPAFEAVLNGDIAPAGAEPLTPDSLATCFVQASRVLAAERPTILLIDDLHFAPAEARSLFSALAMALPGHRVLLVGTTRPGVEGDWRGNLQRLEHVDHIHLERLFPKDLVALLRDSFGSESLASSLAAQIAVKSDGNPFFAFEIIRGLRDGQFITRRDDGTWESTGVIDEIAIPSSVLDLVNARVADLSDAERNVLDVAACCGFEFDPLLVGDVLELRQIPLMRLLAHVEKKHRLVRAAGRRFVFDHHQVQESLYEAMPELLREPYHAALADALAARIRAPESAPETLDGALCVDLCEHYLKGARGEDALRYLEAAQAHLSKACLPAQMVALTERALAVPGLLAGRERANALLRLLPALDSLGRRGRQETLTREVADLAEDLGDESLRDRAAAALGILCCRLSRLAEAETCYRQALERAQARGDKRREAVHSTGLGNVFFAQARLSEALEWHERAIAAICETGDLEDEGKYLTNLAGALIMSGRLAEAREHLERAFAISRQVRHPAYAATVRLSLASLEDTEGRPYEAQQQRERALELSREIGDRRQEAIALVNIGPGWRMLGDPERARQALDASVALCREIGAYYPEGFGLLGLSQVAADEGDLAEARRLAEESLALRRRIRHRDGVVRTLLHLGEVLALAGEAAEACAALEEGVALARELGADAMAAGLVAELAALPGGDAAPALAALAELDGRHDTPELRWTLHRATGDREHLDEAKRLLDEQLTRIPAELHEPIRRNVRVAREILAAWHGEQATVAGIDQSAGEPGSTESETRIAPHE